jgi:hypothetical protein
LLTIISKIDFKTYKYKDLGNYVTKTNKIIFRILQAIFIHI